MSILQILPEGAYAPHHQIREELEDHVEMELHGVHGKFAGCDFFRGGAHFHACFVLTECLESPLLGPPCCIFS